MIRSALAPTLATTLLTAFAATAHAGGPDIVSDPTELSFRLAEERNETDAAITAKYTVRVHALIVANRGAIDRQDRASLTWRAGGKVLTTVECELDGSGDQAQVACDGTQPLDAYGDVTAELLYTRNADDSVTTLSTHQLKIGRFWTWYERNGKRKFYARYQVVPLDLLTSAIVWHEDRGAGERRFNVYGWASAEGGQRPEPTSLRCAVDGKKLADFDASVSYVGGLEATDWRDPAVNQRVPQVTPYKIWVGGLVWGSAATLDKSWRNNANGTPKVVMGDHPGAWTCDLREKGKAVRSFAFTVGKDGLVAPHAEQLAGFAIPGTEAIIDARVPDTAPDPYVDPAMSKASGFWGQAWRDPATGPRLAPSFSRPGFEAAPPAGVKSVKPAKIKKRK